MKQEDTNLSETALHQYVEFCGTLGICWAFRGILEHRFCAGLVLPYYTDTERSQTSCLDIFGLCFTVSRPVPHPAEPSLWLFFLHLHPGTVYPEACLCGLQHKRQNSVVQLETREDLHFASFTLYQLSYRTHFQLYDPHCVKDSNDPYNIIGVKWETDVTSPPSQLAVSPLWCWIYPGFFLCP